MKSLGWTNASRSHQDRQGSVQKSSVPDVVGTPFWIECARLRDAKLDKTLALIEAKYAQARRDRRAANNADMPIVVIVSCGRTGSLKMVAVDEDLDDSLPVGRHITTVAVEASLTVVDFGWHAGVVAIEAAMKTRLAAPCES